MASRSSTLLRHINETCWKIVKDVIANKQYASFIRVIAILERRWGISHFKELNVGSPLNVPVLRYLRSLEQKVDPFIYHSVCGRGIYTLKELEIDVVCMLNAFAMYPLDNREFGDDGMESDSNNSDEVYDSDPQDNSGEYGRQGPYGGTKSDCQQQPATRFCDFGVGSLFVHPIVQKLFGPIPNEILEGRVVPKVGVAEVVSLMNQFASNTLGQDSMTRFASPYKSFVKFALRALIDRHKPGRPRDLRHMGIRIEPAAFEAEWQLLLQARHRRRLAGHRRQLERQHAQRSAPATGAHRTTVPKGSCKPPVLRPPTNRRSASVIDEITRRWRIESPYSPSFTKLRAVVAAVCERGAPRRKRKRGGIASQQVAVATDSTLDLITEYAMLYLGSTRYRKKRWTQPSHDESVDSDQNVGEEGDAGARPQTVSCAKSKSNAEGVQAARPNTRPQTPLGAEEDDCKDKSCSGTKTEASKPECGSVPKVEARSSSGTNIDSGEESCDGVGADNGSEVEVNCDDGNSTEEDERAGAGDELKPKSPGQDPKPRHAADDVGTKKCHHNAEVRRGAPKNFQISTAAFSSTFDFTSDDRLFSGSGVLLTPHQLRGCYPDIGASSPAETGRWGEALVFNVLLKACPNRVVHWMNQSGESKAAFDIQVTDGTAQSRTVYIEVKSTRYSDRRLFHLSLWELELAQKLGDNYCVFRVFGSGTEDAYIQTIPNVFRSIMERKVDLCLMIPH